jgi:Tfp pilus assembly protein PilE
MRLKTTLKRRVGKAEGFTLIDLLILLVVLAVVVTIAVASYLGYEDRAADRTAQANLRAAMPAAEAYFNRNETYALMDDSELRAIDAGVSASLRVASAGPSTYCLTDAVSGRTWSMLGPGASLAYRPNATCS